jgi:hypothetical protein
MLPDGGSRPLTPEEEAALAASSAYGVPSPMAPIEGAAPPPTQTVSYPTATGSTQPGTGSPSYEAADPAYGQQIQPAPATSGAPPQPAYSPESSAYQPSPQSANTFTSNPLSTPRSGAPPYNGPLQPTPTPSPAPGAGYSPPTNTPSASAYPAQDYRHQSNLNSGATASPYGGQSAPGMQGGISNQQGLLATYFDDAANHARGMKLAPPKQRKVTIEEHKESARRGALKGIGYTPYGASPVPGTGGSIGIDPINMPGQQPSFATPLPPDPTRVSTWSPTDTMRPSTSGQVMTAGINEIPTTGPFEAVGALASGAQNTLSGIVNTDVAANRRAVGDLFLPLMQGAARGAMGDAGYQGIPNYRLPSPLSPPSVGTWTPTDTMRPIPDYTGSSSAFGGGRGDPLTATTSPDEQQRNADFTDLFTPAPSTQGEVSWHNHRTYNRQDPGQLDLTPAQEQIISGGRRNIVEPVADTSVAANRGALGQAMDRLGRWMPDAANTVQTRQDRAAPSLPAWSPTDTMRPQPSSGMWSPTDTMRPPAVSAQEKNTSYTPPPGMDAPPLPKGYTADGIPEPGNSNFVMTSFLDAGYVDGGGRWTPEGLAAGQQPDPDLGVVLLDANGAWTPEAAAAGVVPPEAVGLIGSGWAQPSTRDAPASGEPFDPNATAPIELAEVLAVEGGNAPSGGGGGYSRRSYGGGGGYSGGGGGGFSPGRNFGGSFSSDDFDDSGWEDFLKDFDNDGDTDEKDEAKARKLAVKSKRTRRGKRGGKSRVPSPGLGGVPSFPESEIRTNTLSAIEKSKSKGKK